MTISLPASRERIESTWGGSGWLTNEIVHYVYDGNLVLQERRYNNPLPGQSAAMARSKMHSA